MRLKQLFIFGLILLIGFASAGNDLGIPTNSYSNIYGPDSTFSGWLNISFDLEPLSSIISDNFGNSILLKNLLDSKMNSNYNYDCNRIGCASEYNSLDSSSEMSFYLKKGTSKVIGFVFKGSLESFDSADFDVASNASVSCENQLEIDLFDDGTVDIENTRQSNQTCGIKDYSCFNFLEKQDEISLSSTPFCQRFTLEKSPGYVLGAWVKEITGDKKNVTMSLYDEAGNFLDECNLKKEEILNEGGEASCEVNYSINNRGDYYVCIKIVGEGSGDYKTRGYFPEDNACGFFGRPIKPELNNYQIFVQKSKYAPVENFSIGEKFSSKEKFGSEIENYIKRNYGSLDCSNECLVPIRFSSNEDQLINLNHLKIIYNKTGLPGIKEENFYNFYVNMSEISSKLQKLYLDPAEFLLPSELGSYNYDLFLNSKKIFDGTLKIENISIDIFPKTAPVIFESKITAIFRGPFEIKEYEWNFGDGSTVITNNNSVMHSYKKEGNYLLSLKLKDDKGNILSKTFEIEVATSRKIMEKVIEDLNKKIDGLESQMESLDSFSKEVLEKYLGLNNTKSLLESIKSNISSSTEEEYGNYVQQLLEINLPESFIRISNGKIIYFPNKDFIDLASLAEAQNETLPGGDQASYKNAILVWFHQHVSAQLSTDDISYKMGDENILPGFKVFTLSLNPKNGSIGEDYIILKNLKGIQFEEDYGQKLIDGYYIFKVGGTRTIKFSTTERITFQTLPFYISPKLSEVFVAPDVLPENEDEVPNSKFLYVFLIILVGIGIGAYFLVNLWYVKKYEKHLFPEINNLYNMINYIHISKQKNMEDSEIKINLKKVGWNSEQINYALKKYKGKEVAMPGLGKLTSKMNPPVNKGGQNLNK